MKTRLLYIALALCTWCGCHQDPKNITWIQGQVEGLDGSPLLVYGIDGFFDRIDTLMPKGDEIKSEIMVDTLVETIILTPDGNEFPLFLEPGSKLKITGHSSSSLMVSGSPANDMAYEFLYKLLEIPNSHAEEKRQLAIDYISQNPDNIASTYIIRTLVLEADSINWDLAAELDRLLSPSMRERLLMARLTNRINNEAENLPTFSMHDTEGKLVSRFTYNGSWLLINFWASWDSKSRSDNKLVYSDIYKNQSKKGKLKMLGISLDTDREEWIKAIEEDSIQWRQICGRRGWETDLIQSLHIERIPYNVLVNKRGRIIAQNVTEKEIENLIQEETE